MWDVVAAGLTQCGRAANIDPVDSLPVAVLGGAAFYTGRTAGVLERAREAVEARPSSWLIQRAFGLALAGAGRHGGTQLPGQLDRLGSAAGLAHNSDVGRERQQRCQPFTHQALIVSDEDSDLVHGKVFANLMGLIWYCDLHHKSPARIVLGAYRSAQGRHALAQSGQADAIVGLVRRPSRTVIVNV